MIVCYGKSIIFRSCYLSHLSRLYFDRAICHRNYTSKKVEMIRLLDAKGQILGLKSKQDAEEYAHKHNMVLKFMPVTAKSKYTEYMAIPRSEMTFECENDDEKQVDAKEDSKKMLLQVKKLTFNYNIQENDLEVKIRAVRKHVKKIVKYVY